jgi:hypothetical protein
MSSCTHLEAALRSGEDSDIDGKGSYLDFKFPQDFIPMKEMALHYRKRPNFRWLEADRR